jgi:hypothetical protein
MKMSYLIVNFAMLASALTLPLTMQAREFGSSGSGGERGGFRSSPEYQNDVNAGGRGGTYHPQARTYERGQENGSNQSNYNSGSNNNNNDNEQQRDSFRRN